MKKKPLLALVLLLCLLLPQAFAQSDWQKPYNKDSGYTYVHFGRYPQTKEGEEQPILWRVLESTDGVVYLLSESILDVAMLHSVAFGYPGWAEADVNLWLQKDFIQKAFTEEEQAALKETELGRASLPSSDDLKNKAYGFATNQSRRALGTPWADSQGLFFYRHKGHSPYWTRTPSDRPHAHRSIKLEGNLGYLGVTNRDMGIRPVIWLVAAQVEVRSGSGSLADPYLLGAKAQE